MMWIAVAFVLGVVAGLRTMTAVAVTSWAARLGWLHVDGSPMAFLNFHWTPWVLTVMALGEFVGDKLPMTPSRKAPPLFAGRVLCGALCGTAVGVSAGNLWAGLAIGVAGAVVGTLGGAAARSTLTRLNGGRDFPVALAEDVVAVLLAVGAVRLGA